MRLIDADTLKAEFTGNFHEIWHYTGVRATIDNAPTIDAVPVVRCKDCIYFRTFKTSGGIVKWCSCDPRAYKDHFCGFGERKDNANHSLR